MNIVFLVGNGFDQKLSLHTSSSAFITAFVNEYSNENITQPENKLANRIKRDGIKTWAAFEEKLGEHSRLFTLEDKDQYLQQAYALVSYLDVWLEREQKRISDSTVGAIAKNCIGSTATFQGKLPPLRKKQINNVWSNHSKEDVTIDFLCFNYTDCFSRLYQQAGGAGAVIRNRPFSQSVRLGELIYVHENLQGSIVCGVDSPEQISNPELRNDLQVVNTLVKKEMQEKVLYSDSHQRGLEAISRATIICIFGMSYGVTDRRWWEEALKQIRKDSEALLVLFAYSKDKVRKSILDIENRNSREVSDFFAGAGASDSDESLSSRIIVADSMDVFPVKTNSE